MAIPYWCDEWPFSRLHFHDKPKCVAYINDKASYRKLRFVNWCMSFLADKVAAASTTYVAIAKAAGAEIQTRLNRVLAHTRISRLAKSLDVALMMSFRF